MNIKHETVLKLLSAIRDGEFDANIELDRGAVKALERWVGDGSRLRSETAIITPVDTSASFADDKHSTAMSRALFTFLPTFFENMAGLG